MYADICLVNMPYSSITRPSLALGLIENYISEYGYKLDIIYGNLEFASVIGLNEYDVIDNSYHEHLLGEWTFSRCAFPNKAVDDEGFFELFTDITDEIKQQLLAVREQAESFIIDLAKRILIKDPKIVGCTSTFQQNCASLALLRQIKESQPNVITLLGGANCEGAMGKAISDNFSWVDYVFSGECDDVIGGFVDKLMQGESIGEHNLPFGFIRQLPELIMIEQIKESPTPRGYLEDMNLVATPIFDSYFATINALALSPYIKSGLIAETSRGCWWGAKKHCTFCGLNGVSMTHRIKSAETVIEEFNLLSSKYHINKFEIVDNILPMEYMKTLLPQLSIDQAYSIFYETKSNLKKAHIEKLANAGIRWIQPGFESLNDDFLKLVAKGATAIQNVSALKWCRNFGIRVSWNLLSAAPLEKLCWYVEMAEILPLLEHMQPPYHQMIKIRYVRFSPYFKQAEQYGLTLAPLKSYQYVYPLKQQQLFNIAYFFEEESIKTAGIFSLRNSNQHDIPEHKLLQSKITQWCDRWVSGSVPLLYMSDQGDKIVIIDTRKIATSFSHELKGLSMHIYRFCTEPVSKSRLFSLLLAFKLTDERGCLVDEQQLKKQIEECLHILTSNKILLPLSHCYLSLALEGNAPELPDVEDYPAGYLDLNEGR